MKDETKVVFRGDLEDCLRHLRERFDATYPKGTHGISRALEPMADFCGVAIQTVQKWLQGMHPPVGKTIFKLQGYLELLGYRLVERETIHINVRNFSELVICGVMSPEDAAEALGYKDVGSLYGVFRGVDGSSAAKLEKMLDIWKEKREDLERKKELGKRHIINLDVSATLNQKTPTVASGGLSSLTRSEEATLHLMRGLQAMFEDGVFGELRGSVKEALARDMVIVVQLSSHLGQLSAQLVSGVKVR